VEIYKSVVGKHSLHDKGNDNGVKLRNFAINREINISSAQFPRKNIYKHTWVSPGGRYISQIDHVLISNRYKSNITNCKSYRRADIDSYHYLVIRVFKSKMAVKWNNEGKLKAARKFDVESIKKKKYEKISVNGRQKIKIKKYFWY
jgi:hypothetical protein